MGGLRGRPTPVSRWGGEDLVRGGEVYVLDAAVAVYCDVPALAVPGAAGRQFVCAFVALDANVGGGPT